MTIINIWKVKERKEMVARNANFVLVTNVGETRMALFMVCKTCTKLVKASVMNQMHKQLLCYSWPIDIITSIHAHSACKMWSAAYWTTFNSVVSIFEIKISRHALIFKNVFKFGAGFMFRLWHRITHFKRDWNVFGNQKYFLSVSVQKTF